MKNPRLVQREQLHANLVALESGEDGFNDQRCLYLDKVNESNIDRVQKNVENYAALEVMKQEIINKEEELVAIGDA